MGMVKMAEKVKCPNNKCSGGVLPGFLGMRNTCPVCKGTGYVDKKR
jgi:DnaJ-class molecular chaperone